MRRAQQRLVEIGQANEHVLEYKAADGNVRHKCFLSYHAADAEEVLGFVESFDSVFIPKCLGVDEDDPWIDSEDTDYIMDRVRDKYLSESTVTIVLVGKCTWARKFVDWEIYSSLRRDRVNRLNGLLAIQLPSVAAGVTLPDRVSDNVLRDRQGSDFGYGRYYVYPSSKASLQSWIQDAFDARRTRDQLIRNGRARKKYNSAC
ncbi:TIR domain-containing protein [Blastococcus sp. SYSU DS0619]